MKILVIGDLMEDLIVRPKETIRFNTDTAAVITRSPGGAAANVAAWLAFLGKEVSFASCVGESDAISLAHEMKVQGIEPILQVSEKPTGSLVVLVDGDSRSMLTDRGANDDLKLEEIDPKGFGIIYLSGYALLGKTSDAVAAFIGRCKSVGALISIDPGSTGFISDYGTASFRELVASCDISLPNQEEENLLGLSGKMPLTIITKGPLGSEAVWANGERIQQPAAEIELVDPTGAGDAFAAGFLAEMAESSNPLSKATVEQALRNGVQVGGRAAHLVGARP